MYAGSVFNNNWCFNWLCSPPGKSHRVPPQQVFLIPWSFSAELTEYYSSVRFDFAVEEENLTLILVCQVLYDWKPLVICAEFIAELSRGLRLTVHTVGGKSCYAGSVLTGVFSRLKRVQSFE